MLVVMMIKTFDLHQKKSGNNCEDTSCPEFESDDGDGPGGAGKVGKQVSRTRPSHSDYPGSRPNPIHFLHCSPNTCIISSIPPSVPSCSTLLVTFPSYSEPPLCWRQLFQSLTRWTPVPRLKLQGAKKDHPGKMCQHPVCLSLWIWPKIPRDL